MRTQAQANDAIERYADLVWRIGLVHVKHFADAQDVFQTVFLKYLQYTGVFENEEHEKAWLIRVTINTCKDHFRKVSRQAAIPPEFFEPTQQVSQEHRELLEAVRSLPPKYRDVIYLHYFEGYAAAEIGTILKKKENSIYTLLSRARERLREQLGGEGFAE